MSRKSSGDTLVEVILSFAVFALIAVAAIAIMNRGVNMVDRSLEITLVREQIDSQAALLRYAHETKSAAWDEVRNNLGQSSEAARSWDTCPTPAELPTNAFMMNLADSGQLVRTVVSNNATAYTQASTNSQFAFRGEPSVRGIWVVPVAVEGATNTYDMYISTCWYSPGSSVPETIGTIVRLYDAPAMVVTTPPTTPTTCDNLESYSNNLIVNGDFSISAGPGPGVAAAAGFTSDLPNRGSGVYPDDTGINGTAGPYTGGFSLQNTPTPRSYGIHPYPNAMWGGPFPGDPARGVPALNTWFYSNPNQRVDQPAPTTSTFSGVLWRQTIPVTPNTLYDFTAYFSNVLRWNEVGSADPLIQLRANGIAITSIMPIPRGPDPPNPDAWYPVSLVFTSGPSDTSVTLDIYDTANDIDGDDFGMTGLALRRCIP